MEKLQEINSKYALIAELKLYLESTDYHILKQAEGNYQAPQDILFQRAEARENINALEDEIRVLVNEADLKVLELEIEKDIM